MANANDTSTELLKVLKEVASSLAILAKNSAPAVKDHPCAEMSNEEVAIVLLARGQIKTKRQAAEILGVTERAVQDWKRFAVAFRSFKAKERLGQVRLGGKDANGDIYQRGQF